MIRDSVQRDERTVSVENTSYRWAYLFLSFGLLVSVAYRAFARSEQSWDLLALVIAGGAIATLYQGKQHVLGRRWAVLIASAVAAAVVLAVVQVVLIQ